MAHINLFAAYFGTSDTGELKQSVDELPHALHSIANTANIVPSSLVNGLLVVLFERKGEAIDGAKRRAQVVRHGVAEGLEAHD